MPRGTAHGPQSNDAHETSQVQNGSSHSGHCFFIDATDQDTKSTFALLMELARLEVPGHAGQAPILTIPLGGR